MADWEDPERGLIIGSIVFLIILIATVFVLSIIFRKGMCCYANNFAIILICMAYIMYACTYLCQMYPLVRPEKAIETK